MSPNPVAPRLIRGAIIGVDIFNPLASVIVFQYNPDSVTRRLEPRTTGGSEGDRSEALRLTGPPKETITMQVEVDSADQPGGAVQAVVGVHPPIAAMEMLVYPKSVKVFINLALSLAGNIEIIPPEAPLTLLVWGPARVVPVRVTGISVTEEQFDTLLSPTRAKVDLTLQVLSYYDLRVDSVGNALFLAHQITKEVFATANAVASVANFAQGLRLI